LYQAKTGNSIVFSHAVPPYTESKITTDEIPRRGFSHQPKMRPRVLAALNFVSIWPLKNKFYTNE